MSLTDHLRTPDTEQHSRLAFHRSCPICRHTRLTGPLPDLAAIPTKAQAGLAAGVLAAGALLSPVAALAEPGLAGGAGDGASLPPGGDGTGQLVQPPAPGTPSSPAAPPASVRPGDPAITPPGPSSGESGQGDNGSPGPGVSTPTSVPAPPSHRMPTPDPRNVAGHGQGSGHQQDPSAAMPHRSEHRASPRLAAPAPGAYSTPTRAQRGAPRVSPTPPGVAAAFPSTGRANRRPAPRPTRAAVDHVTYVVEPGDCLWSIAERHLDPQANNAQIAALVERLWQLNHDRIATGDPNLVYPGQHLRMPT